MTIHFGTDGWRGVIAEDYTFNNLRRCAQGFASYMLAQGKKGQWIVVGYDKRFGSEHFAAAVAEVLAGNGLKVYLTDIATPTPVIAYAVVKKKAAGAVTSPEGVTNTKIVSSSRPRAAFLGATSTNIPGG